jgi:putative transposase
LPEASELLGVSQQTLRHWLKREDVDAGRAEGVTSDEGEELRRLRREVRVLREEGEILKSGGLLRQGERDPVAVFRFIEAEKANHAIATMCRVLRVSRSGYYAWAARPPSERAVANVALVVEIRRVHAESTAPTGPVACTPSCAVRAIG